MDELPPDSRALLDAAAGADDPEPEERQAADRRIRATLSARGMAGLGPLAPREVTDRRQTSSGDQASMVASTAGTGAAVRLALGLSGMAIALVGVGFSVLDTISAPVVPPPQAPLVEHTKGPLSPPVAAPTSPVSKAPPSHPPLEPASPTPAPPRGHAHRPRAAVKHALRRAEARERVGDGDHRVREELRLIAAADRAVRDGQSARALQLLGDHARRFQHGFLVVERRALRVLALCKQGKHAELTARQRSQALRGASNSVLAARIREACGLPAEAP